MKATEKMEAFGLKALAEKTGKDLSLVYRWRKALLEGSGISDLNKRLLIAATEGSEHAILWADFTPTDLLFGAPIPA